MVLHVVSWLWTLGFPHSWLKTIGQEATSGSMCSWVGPWCFIVWPCLLYTFWFLTRGNMCVNPEAMPPHHCGISQKKHASSPKLLLIRNLIRAMRKKNICLLEENEIVFTEDIRWTHANCTFLKFNTTSK